MIEKMSQGYTAKEIMISVLLEFHIGKNDVVERELNRIGVRLFKQPHRLIGMASGSEIWMGDCPLSVLQGGQLASLPCIKLAWIGLESSIKTILSCSKK